MKSDFTCPFNCGRMPNGQQQMQMMPTQYEPMDMMEDEAESSIYMPIGYNQPAAVSNRRPILTNNAPEQYVALVKELTGYNNYGNPSGNADILYTGNRGTWTFNIPRDIFPGAGAEAQLLIAAILDDHYDSPARNYSATISINNTVVYRGELPLGHGSPPGDQFRNWRTLTFNVPNLRRNNTVTISNTSRTNANDWIGLDWMELRFPNEEQGNQPYNPPYGQQNQNQL